MKRGWHGIDSSDDDCAASIPGFGFFAAAAELFSRLAWTARLAWSAVVLGLTACVAASGRSCWSFSSGAAWPCVPRGSTLPNRTEKRVGAQFYLGDMMNELQHVTIHSTTGSPADNADAPVGGQLYRGDTIDQPVAPSKKKGKQRKKKASQHGQPHVSQRGQAMGQQHVQSRGHQHWRPPVPDAGSAMEGGDPGTIDLIANQFARGVPDASGQNDGAEPTGIDETNCKQRKHAETLQKRFINANLCVDKVKKILPEFYLLGAEHSGTNSFAADLLDWGIQNALPSSLGIASAKKQRGQKEFHFFDQRFPILRTTVASVINELVRRTGRDCTPNRQTLADFTPVNLRLVPLPANTTFSSHLWGEWAPKDRTDFEPKAFNLPIVLKKVYGVRWRAVKFAILLREPLHRMYSAKQNKHCSECSSFDACVRAFVTEARHENFKACLWASMYGRQLQAWLHQFDAVQFFVVPTFLYVGDGLSRSLLCNALTSTFRFSLNCNSRPSWFAEAETNSQKTVNLKDVISKETSTQFAEFMEPENKLLVGILAKMFDEGATLYGYRDCGGNDSIAEWLQSNW